MIWILLAFTSALFSAAAAVVQKRTLFELTALELSFFASIAILAASSFVPFFADVTSISRTQALIIVGKSILGGIAFILVMLSLKHNEISNALPLLGLTPAVTALLAAVTIHESLQAWEWTGILLMMAGVFIVEKRPDQKIMEPFVTALTSRKHFYIVGALLLFALSSVADKALVGNYRIDPLVVLFYQHIVYALLFGAALLIRPSSLRTLVAKGRAQFPAIIIIALLTIAYRLTQLEATKDAPVALVLAIKRTSILYASFVGGRMFSEERLRMRLLGGVLIVLSGFIILRNVG